jgi:hypothetical protein
MTGYLMNPVNRHYVEMAKPPWADRRGWHTWLAGWQQKAGFSGSRNRNAFGIRPFQIILYASAAGLPDDPASSRAPNEVSWW